MYLKENLRIIVCFLIIIITTLLSIINYWLQFVSLSLSTPSAIYICHVYLYFPDLDLHLDQWNVDRRDGMTD